MNQNAKPSELLTGVCGDVDEDGGHGLEWLADHLQRDQRGLHRLLLACNTQHLSI